MRVGFKLCCIRNIQGSLKGRSLQGMSLTEFFSRNRIPFVPCHVENLRKIITLRNSRIPAARWKTLKSVTVRNLGPNTPLVRKASEVIPRYYVTTSFAKLTEIELNSAMGTILDNAPWFLSFKDLLLSSRCRMDQERKQRTAQFLATR